MHERSRRESLQKQEVPSAQETEERGPEAEAERRQDPARVSPQGSEGRYREVFPQTEPGMRRRDTFRGKL